MSVNYAKYRAMTPEQIQHAVDEGKVSWEYLNWLGISGQGKTLREIVNAEKVQSAYQEAGARKSKAEPVR
jgi:hypothetical protein